MNEDVWNNREAKQQVINFTGLARDKIMPCDLDACLEYKNRGYVFIEAKYEKAPMPKGQELMYARLADDLDRAGKPTLFIVAEHSQKDVNTDIDLANANVRMYYYQGQLFEPKEMTVKKIYDIFVDSLERRRNG